MTQPEPGAEDTAQPQPPPFAGTYGQPPQMPQGPSPYAQPDSGQPYAGVPGYGAGSYGGLASRWARFGASLLDGLLIGTISLVLSAPFMDWEAMMDPTAETPLFSTGDLVNSAISIVLGFFYYWLMHARMGQTLGKMALSIRVVREEDGGAISSGTSAWRYGVQILLSLPCGIGSLVDALWIFGNPRNQTLHDKIAHTLVVKVEPGMPNPYRNR